MKQGQSNVGEKRKKKIYTTNMRPSYYVPTTTVEKNQKFYNDADVVVDDIEKFKARLQRRNREFELLQEYYERHRGVLDVHNRPTCGPRAMRPNLGTKDQSWYYLDGFGNKIWVRDVRLDTSDPRCGAFEGNQNDDGRVIVIKVPKVRTNCAILHDYQQKLQEYDGTYRLPHTIPTTVVAPNASASSPNHLSTIPAALLNNGKDCMQVDKSMADQVGHVRGPMKPEYVWRPPASVEEAEMRLAQLKREEAELMQQRKGV